MTDDSDQSSTPEGGVERSRLKYFGTGDYGTYFQVEQAFDLLNGFDSSTPPNELNDIIELYNAQLFAENGLFPKSSSEQERAELLAKLSDIRRVIAQFFSAIGDATIAAAVANLDSQYHDDVLTLLTRFKAHQRCAASAFLPALEAAGVRLHDLLTSKPVVQAYDHDVHALILADPRNAELLVAKFLQPDGRHPIHLPASWTPADSRTLLDAYLDDPDANQNFVRMISTARVSKDTGVDAKMKLKARRKYDKFTEDFFKNNAGMKSGSEVSISDSQTEEVVASLDGMVAKYSYSQAWLSQNLDFPTVLNNFVYLFEFANEHMQWNLPSFAADFGVFERIMRPDGKEAYHTGAAFRMKDQTSLLQTIMYDHFLRSNDIELESVIQWFFEKYLPDEFGADNLKFQPSSPTATYLEKSRHLFSEMESVLKQFKLYVENGELDRELLSMTSEQLSYKQLPSVLDGKYVYTTSDPTINRIQHLLFSDQSHLTYISDELNDTSFARLIIANAISYDSFAEHQRREIDFLVSEGIVVNTGDRVKLVDAPQFLVLRDICHFEAASYYHFSPGGQAAIDSMVAKGWLVRRTSLLSTPEASYVNYLLNQSEFTNGPDLRNRYLHGSQADGDDNRVHFYAYITAVRTLVALVIKVNDDFELRKREDVEGKEAEDT